MSVLPVGFGSSGVDTGDIGHSLRFRSAASARLARTPPAAPTRRQVTFSFWFKRGTLGAAMRLFQTRDNGVSSGNAFGIYLNAANDLDVYQYSSAYTLLFRTSAVFRDPTSWNHLVVAIDTTQATSADRVKLYLNGVSLTSSTYTAPALNLDLYWDSAVQHNIGCFDSTGSYSNFFDGEFARIAVVSQQQLTPADFGYQNTEINEWVSKSQSAVKAVVDAGGTNSFMLDFDDGTSLTTLGYDKSSKGNNWTLTNVSITPGPTYDWMLDVPGNSYATLNPLRGTGGTLSAGNLTFNNGVASHQAAVVTQAVTSGKWYAEGALTAIPTGAIVPGIGIRPITAGNVASGEFAGSIAGSFGGVCGPTNMVPYSGGVAGTAMAATITSTSVAHVALDVSAGKVWIGIDGAWIGGGDPAAGTLPTYTFTAGTGFEVYCSAYATVMNLLCGQAPLHTAAVYAGAALGYFRYTPPTGFKALCQANLPDPAILNPELHFDVRTRTGDAASPKALMSDLLFPPGFIWTKDRSVGYQHTLQDIVRGTGASKKLYSSLTEAENGANSVYGYISSFDSNGVTATVGSSGFQHLNANGVTYVDWLWKAGGAAVTNNAGSVSSQVSANTTAGFSIVTATLTATNQTIGHGVGAVPKFIVGFKRNGTSSHPCYHSGLSSAANVVYLDTTAAQAASATTWNSTAPTSTVFSVGTGLTGDWVFYCFAEIPGYSKIGSYTGNGSADGPFVECGFKPKFIMYKRSDAVSNWVIWDSVRSPDNVVNDYLLPNSSAAEATLDTLDITSSGFKLRTANADNNGGTIVFIAFADVAGKYSLGR